jgi:hypothetical protein
MVTLTGAPGLLEQAVGYTLSTTTLATPRLLPQPTPCTGWDLRALVLHVSDSLGVLTEAVQAGQIGAGGAPGGEPDPVTCLRRQARDLLRACASSSSATAS